MADNENQDNDDGYRRYPPANANDDSESEDEPPRPHWSVDETLYETHDDSEATEVVEIGAPYPPMRELRRGMRRNVRLVEDQEEELSPSDDEGIASARESLRVEGDLFEIGAGDNNQRQHIRVLQVKLPAPLAVNIRHCRNDQAEEATNEYRNYQRQHGRRSSQGLDMEEELRALERSRPGLADRWNVRVTVQFDLDPKSVPPEDEDDDDASFDGPFCRRAFVHRIRRLIPESREATPQMKKEVSAMRESALAKKRRSNPPRACKSKSPGAKKSTSKNARKRRSAENDDEASSPKTSPRDVDEGIASQEEDNGSGPAKDQERE